MDKGKPDEINKGGVGGSDEVGAEESVEHLEEMLEVVANKFPEYEFERRQADRPFFIEFAGTPKSGKTTAVQTIERLLRRNNVRVKTLVERASSCPLRSKDNMFFNVWTACATLTQMLEARDSDDQVILVDRGLFDSLCWMHWFTTTGRLAESERNVISDFIMLKRWVDLVDVVVVLTVDPITALRRESMGQLTLKPGSIMNEKTLKQFNSSMQAVLKETSPHFKSVYCLETSHGEARDNVAKIAKHSLARLEDFLDEPILVFPRDLLIRAGIEFPAPVETAVTAPAGFFLASDLKVDLVSEITVLGQTLFRSQAEKSADLVQPIPLAYLRYEDKILLLRRKEVRRDDRLHNKFAIWAGGHVRDQDKMDGPVLMSCLSRELNEELYLKVHPEPRFVGAVYDDSSEKSRRHLGLVYEMVLESPQVALGMDQTEFRETRGKSMSGRLVGRSDLDSYFDKMEYWSQAILSRHLKMVSRSPARQAKFAEEAGKPSNGMKTEARPGN